MSQTKSLFILHTSPPIHGAAKVGDILLKSERINKELDTRYIRIKSSITLGDINKFSFLKLFFVIELFIKVAYQLIVFRPRIIYFTASPYGLAFYRDLMISLFLKLYRFASECHIFYHYHQEGINSFVSTSKIKNKLTNFFVKNTNLIFITKIMVSELENIQGYKTVYFLNNGISDQAAHHHLDAILEDKLKSKTINILYLSSMIRAKGYKEVLKLANKIKQEGRENIKFRFAGAYFSATDRIWYEEYIEKNRLHDVVEYMGFVNENEKDTLFNNTHMLIYPSKRDVFPLTILEALSYGVPTLAFNTGAISEIISEKTGMISNEERLHVDFHEFMSNYLNLNVYLECRKAYLNSYTNEIFENNFLDILKLR